MDILIVTSRPEQWAPVLPVMEGRGASVRQAGSLEQGLELVRRQAPALAVLDLGLEPDALRKAVIDILMVNAMIHTAAVKRVQEILRSKSLIPCTACRYCTAGCPQHISIPDLFAVMNAKQIHRDWNADYYYDETYTKSGGRASDCIRCGKCEKVCPQHLHIRDLLADVAAEFEKKG